MALKKDERDVARFLYCLSILEEKVANAYKSYSESTENPDWNPYSSSSPTTASNTQKS